MTALISDMLDLTKIEAGKMPMEMEEVPLIRVVQRVAGQMVPLLQKKRLTLDIREEGMMLKLGAIGFKIDLVDVFHKKYGVGISDIHSNRIL